jgi:hypothetical protein
MIGFSMFVHSNADQEGGLMQYRAEGLRLAAAAVISACAAILLLTPKNVSATPLVTQGWTCEGGHPGYGCAFDSANIGVVSLEHTCTDGDCYTCYNSPGNFCNGTGGYDKL